MERRYRERPIATGSVKNSKRIPQNNRPRGTCEGYRLRPEALAVKIGHSRPFAAAQGQVVRCPFVRRSSGATSVPEALSPQKNEIAKEVLKEIRERLGFLNNVV